MKESLVIRMSMYKEKDEPDELGRYKVGYHENMTDTEIYESAKGIWSIDARRYFKNIKDIYIVEPYDNQIVLHIKPMSLHALGNGFYIGGYIEKDSKFLKKQLKANDSSNSIKYIESPIDEVIENES